MGGFARAPYPQPAARPPLRADRAGPREHVVHPPTLPRGAGRDRPCALPRAHRSRHGTDQGDDSSRAGEPGRGTGSAGGAAFGCGPPHLRCLHGDLPGPVLGSERGAADVVATALVRPVRQRHRPVGPRAGRGVGGQG